MVKTLPLGEALLQLSGATVIVGSEIVTTRAMQDGFNAPLLAMARMSISELPSYANTIGLVPEVTPGAPITGSVPLVV